MLRRDAGKSVSICDGFRKRDFFHMGRGFLPLLAVMFLAVPQLAVAQGNLAATVDPRSLEITETSEWERDGDLYHRAGCTARGYGDGDGRRCIGQIRD